MQIMTAIFSFFVRRISVGGFWYTVFDRHQGNNKEPPEWGSSLFYGFHRVAAATGVKNVTKNWLAAATRWGINSYWGAESCR